MSPRLHRICPIVGPMGMFAERMNEEWMSIQQVSGGSRMLLGQQYNFFLKANSAHFAGFAGNLP